MKEKLTLKWNSQGIEEECSVDEDFLSELLVKDLFHPRSCPFQLVPISVVGTKMESGWGRWGYGPLTVMLSFSFSSLLHFWFSPRYLLCLFELKSISGLRTRPRSTGIRVQLTSPFLPPSVSRCEVEVGQSAQVNSRTEERVVVHCGGGSPANLLFNHPLSPAVHLDWFPNNNIFLWYSILIFIRYSCSIRNIFFIKVSTEGDLDSINR